MPLTDAIVATAVPRDSAYKLTSVKGLYLLVNPDGSRYWRFDYRFEGKRKTLSMGVYPEISLDIARTRRDEARELLAQHVNPAEVRKQVRSSAVAKISQPSLQFSMTDSGGLLIENKSGKMVLSAEQVIALRAFIDATREEQPCL